MLSFFSSSMDCSLVLAILVMSQVIVGLSVMIGVMLEVWSIVINLSSGDALDNT